MSDTYKLIDLVGTSSESYEDAIKSAVAAAAKTLDDLCWFEVKELRGRITHGEVAEFQVKLAAAFKVKLDD